MNPTTTNRVCPDCGAAVFNANLIAASRYAQRLAKTNGLPYRTIGTHSADPDFRWAVQLALDTGNSMLTAAEAVTKGKLLRIADVIAARKAETL